MTKMRVRKAAHCEMELALTALKRLGSIASPSKAGLVSTCVVESVAAEKAVVCAFHGRRSCVDDRS